MPAAVTTASCELCGAADWRPHLAAVRDYISGEHFDLERCGACGLIVTCPMPSAEQMERHYPARYRTDRQKHTGGWRVRRRAAMLARKFPRGFRGRVLDLGCGSGEFAMEMHRRGWTVAVTELNRTVLEKMRSQGMEALTPDEAYAGGFKEPFDAITCWHVLEHVAEPLRLARWSRKNLSMNGAFQVTVPNLDSWQAKRFGRDWMHLDVPRHCYHFTPATLGRLLTATGFSVASTSTLALEYDLFGVMQSALNRISSRPNVLFERLTGDAANASTRDVAIMYLAGPWLGLIGLPYCFAAWAAGRGGTLMVTAKALAPSPLEGEGGG
jgi:SAM-dependent methyltransferase